MKWEKCREIMEQHAIKIDDIATEDAYFLATHMPFSKLEVYEGGHTSGNPALLSEDEVFDQLVFNPNNQHRMIIVRGNNGTGKSHLIRYLKAKYENSPATVYNPEREQLVFLRRLNNSVRGALSQLLEQKVIRNSEVEEKLRKFVESTESKDETSFKNDIFYAYVAAVSSDQSNNPYRSVICRDIASYMSDSRVKEFLLREGGAISRCYQVITSSSNQVLKENVIFTVDDFNDRRIIRAVKKQGDPQAIDFATTLSEGPEEIEKLVNYLNRFTRDVVQRCAGVSSESTKAVFEELRKDLKKQGKNLTLFIEDFTGFTGIDSEMITVLSTEHGGDYDYLCRVTAIIGITDGYYDQFKDNFKDRVTHQISVTERSFGDSDFLIQMAARYLNAIYTNPEVINKWYQEGGSQSSIPTSGFMPAFAWDSVEIGNRSVTLYPFNKRSLVGLYNNLPVKSPRMFLRDVLRAQLKEFFDGKAYGDQWDFPLNNIRVQMSNAVHSSAIDRKEELSKTDRERIKMVLSLWGDGTATGTINEGVVYFGGVSQLFFNDIALSFNGIGELTEKDSGVSKRVTTPPSMNGDVSDTEDSPLTRPPDPRRNNYILYIEDINNWYVNNTNLQYYPDYRKWLREFICGNASQAGAITWQDLGIPAYIAAERLNNLEAFSIEGQETGYNENAIVKMERSVESRDALIALCQVDYADGWNYEASAYYQQQLIVWLERHRDEIIKNVVLSQNQEEAPQIIAWGLTLQLIRILAFGNTVNDSSPITAIRDLRPINVPEKALPYRTKDWEDFTTYIKNHTAEFEMAAALLNKSALTTMGAIAFAKRDSKREPFYRSAELITAYQQLVDKNWDIRDTLPSKYADNFLFMPAKLLRELYPRIQTIVNAELADSKQTQKQIESYIGPISQDSLIETLNSIRDLFSEFSMNGVFGYKELRDKYEHASPIDLARRIMHAHQQLLGLESRPLMEQYSAFSGEYKSILKSFLVDLQNLDRIVAKEASNARTELSKNAIPEGMDEIVEAAKENLSQLYNRLSEMEVKDDN